MLTPTPTSNDSRTLAWLTLKLLPGLGNRSLLKLVRHFGSAEQILGASITDLDQVVGLRPHAIRALRNRQPSRDPVVEWQMLQKAGFRLVSLNPYVNVVRDALVEQRIGASAARWRAREG